MPLPRFTSNQLYRRLHVGHPTDIEIYRRLSKGARRILDLGCGWGRIALPLAESGYDVVGVDIEPEFLQECQQQLMARGLSERLRVFQADACTIASSAEVLAQGPYDRVLFPYNTLYALGGAERVAQCLSSLVAHLAPEAEVWFDVYDVDDFHSSLETEDEEFNEDDEPEAAVASWEIAGTTIEVFELTQVFPTIQRLTVRYEARDRQTGLTVGEQTLGHDYLLAQDLERIFEASGYSLMGCYPRHALLPESSLSELQSDEGNEQLFYLAYPHGAKGLSAWAP